MPRQRSWTDEQLVVAVGDCYGYRSVLIALGLVPAGGNYVQLRARIEQLKLSTLHFSGAR